jgi:protein-tyrosine phosphatase
MKFTMEDYTTYWNEDGSYRIVASATGQHKIYWSVYADGFTDDNELPAFDTETTVQNPFGNKRCYYHIFSKDSYGVAAPRVLIHDQMINLRDLGGYNTADSRAFVRYGVLYRSCALNEFGASAKALLDSLGLRCILDFRTPVESERFPDPVVPGAQNVNLSPMGENMGVNQFAAGTLDDVAKMGPEVVQAIYQNVLESYRTMVFGNAAYQQMFEMMLDTENVPMLYHCAAGKDRTGLASLLILQALGVPRETIVHDYIITNAARKKKVEKQVAAMVAALGDSDMVRKAANFFMGVEESSIRSSFAAIDAQYQDIGQYYEKELHVSAAAIEKLKAMYLIQHKMQ